MAVIVEDVDEPLERFASAASEFRAALRADEPDLLQWTRRIRNGVARVYLAAALLPEGQVTSEDDPPDRHPLATTEAALARRLASRLGDADAYTEVWDPTGLLDEKTSPIAGSIAWGLAEIDADLAEALEWIAAPHDNLLWDLRFALEQHWGKHAVDVLRPLHILASGYIG